MQRLSISLIPVCFILVISLVVSPLASIAQDTSNCDSSLGYFELGQSQRAILEWTSAIHSFTCDIELNENSNAYFMRGMTYLTLDMTQEAIDDLTHAIDIDTENDYYYSWRGFIHLSEEQYENAINDLDSAIKLNPNVPRYYSVLSGIYYDLDDMDEAEAVLNQAVEKNPEDAEAYALRGYFYYSTDEFDKSNNDFVLSQEIDPLIASKYVAQGDFEDTVNFLHSAIKSYTLAILIEPDLIEAYLKRTTTHIKLQETELANDDIDTAFALDKNPNYYSSFGYVYYLQKDFENALINYRKYLSFVDEQNVSGFIFTIIKYSEDQLEQHFD